MKIRGKLLLIQLALFGGFLIAFALVGFRYYRAYELYRLELQGTKVLNEGKALTRKAEMVPVREARLSVTHGDWNQGVESFDTALQGFLSNKSIRLLDVELKEQISLAGTKWTHLREALLEPYYAEMIRFEKSNIPEEFKSRGYRYSQMMLEQRGRTNDPIYLQLKELDSESLRVNQILKNELIEALSASQSDLIAVISIYINQVFGTTIFLTLLLLGGAAAGGFIFSRAITRHLLVIEKTISEITKGNFDIHLEIKTDDEFGLLSTHFNTLSTELWSRLDALKDIMQDIANSVESEKAVDIDQFYDLIMELAIDSTQADAAMILLPDPEDPQYLTIGKSAGFFPLPVTLPTRVQSDEESIIQYYKNHPLKIGETPYGKAAETQKPLLIKDNAVTQEMEINSNPDNHFFIKAVMIIPLVVSRRLFGVLALCKKTPESGFSDLDFAYMRSFGDFVALTNDTLLKYLELLKKHELTREIEVAADIQKSLLPQKMPDIKHAQIHGFSYAAKGVSGDYFDVFMIDPNRMAVIVCDVSGKGVPASLLMIMIRTVLRTISAPGKNACRILTELNRAITGRLGADRFATIGFFIFDQKAMEISYSNGAHHPLYIFRAEESRFKMFDTDGLPLGIDINAAYGHKKIKVYKGDYLVLYTDGISEARNAEGDELGNARLLRFVAKNSDLEPKKMSDKVKKFLDQFVGTAKQHDDETFLAMRIR